MSSFIQSQYKNRNQTEDDEGHVKKASFKEFICSRKTIIFGFFVAFSISVPILVYYFFINNGTYLEPSGYVCLVSKTYRVPCGKTNITSTECEKLSCCYDDDLNTCFHFLPSKYYYENKKSKDKYEPSLKQTTIGTKQFENLDITVNPVNKNHVSVVLHDGSEAQVSKKLQGDENYIVNKFENKLAIEISRSENDSEMLLSTTLGPVMASEGYWEWTIQITNEKMYGLDEMLIDLDENSTIKTVIYKNKYDNNVMPLFVGYSKGKFNAVRINHQGPLEILVLPSYLIVLKTVIGAKIELDLFVGPTPSDIYQQLLPPQATVPEPWTLGLHICRGGDLSNFGKVIEECKATTENTTFPYSSDCFHENVVNSLILKTIDDKEKAQLYETLQYIKTNNKKLLISLPPQVPFESSLEVSDIYYVNPVKGEEYTGSYLDEDVIFPDYNHKDIAKLLEQIKKVLTYNESVLPDGLVLTDNWPLDDKFQMSNVSFSYYLSDEMEAAMSDTIPWDVLSTDGTQSMYTHNEYGLSQIEATQPIFPNLYLMSTSQVKHELPTVVQNLDISWTNLKKAININLFNSLIGNNYVAVPICGSTKKFDKIADESLCIRWYLMAATMPMMRVSSDFPRRDPANLNTKFATNLVTEALNRRQSLLTHFYTILQSGEPLVRPMFYQFYQDENTLDLDEQYMIGSNILVAQPVLPNKKKLKIYLPEGVWYEIWGGLPYKGKGWITLDIVESDWISFIAQGSIIPFVKENANGTELSLTIGLFVPPSRKKMLPESYEESGSIYFSGGFLNIKLKNNELTFDGITDEIKKDMGCAGRKYLFKSVNVYGIAGTKITLIENGDLCTVNNSATFNITIPS